MDNQVGVNDILSGVISFFRRQVRVLVIFSVLGVVIALFYHNSRKPFYETSAIAISGLYFFENYEDQKILDPQIAVEIVNFVSQDVRQKNRNELSSLLNLPVSLLKT